MAELSAEQAESTPVAGLAEGAWPHPGWRKAAAHEARGAQIFAVTSAPAATPIADMVKAMLSGGIPVEVVVLAVGTAELARGGTVPIAERRRAFDRERKRRASAKAPPAESQHAPPPPELHERSSVVAKPFASDHNTRIPNNWVPNEKWLPSLAENDGVVP
jgi:hypothetical protein